MTKWKRLLCLALVLLLAVPAMPEAYATTGTYAMTAAYAATGTHAASEAYAAPKAYADGGTADGASAAVLRLTKTEGTVEISKSSGKAVSLRDGMRLYNGYSITTAAKSYAWIDLDSAKLIKQDASSAVEVRKSGSLLEVLLSGGDIFFEVSEPLEKEESLNISTSTMTVGIRGTCGWVRITDQWVSQVCILEGTVQCAVSDPVTGQVKNAVLTGGDMAQCVVYPQDQPGDKCDILMDRMTAWDIPGFVLAELVYDVPLCDKILEETGLDILADLASVAGGDPSGRMPDGSSASPEVLGLARTRQDAEEAETNRRLEDIRGKADLQENNISKDPVWGEPSRPTAGPAPVVTSAPPETPTPSICTVSFDYNNIPVSSAVSSVTTNAAGRANLPEISYTPNTDGTLAFRGWFTAPSGGTQVTNDTVFTADQTVYAQWTGWDWAVSTRTRALVSTMHVFGWGRMRDYALTITDGALVTTAPWASLPDITDVTIGEGIEAIGAYAFYGLATMDNADIAGSVKRIGLHAFSGCTGLEAVGYNSAVAQWNAALNGTRAFPTGLPVHCTNGETLTPSAAYSVTFDSQGGSDVAAALADHGRNAAKPADPIREGYTFDGWYQEAACETAWDFDTGIITGDLTLYARWTINTYTVAFDSRGGSDAAAQTIPYGGMAAEPAPAPTREDFFFDGWYTEEACANAWNFGEDTVPANDITLYARWIPSYTITVNENPPGTETAVPYSIKTAIDGTLTSTLSSPERTGYTFLGWYTESTDGEKIDDPNTRIFTGDMTLYAHWTVTQYTVTFSIRGGSAVASAKVEHGSTVPRPADPTYGVNTFGGWYKDYACTNAWDFAADTVTKNTTLYAKWIPVTISFDLNGFPASSAAPASVAAGYSGTLSYSTIPSVSSNEAHASFNGWFTHPTGGEKVTTGTVFSSDQTVYAHWTNWTLAMESSPYYTLRFSGAGEMDDYTYYTAQPWYDNRETIQTVIIGNGITNIGSNMLRDFKSLNNVTIPNSVTRIGARAFSDCIALTSIALPDGVTSIGERAFVGCFRLKTANIPGSVKTIDAYAFHGCALDPVQLPDGLTSIGESAFINCRMTQVVIPASVTSIGAGAFDNCQYLTRITVNSGNPNYTVIDNVLFSKDQKTLMQYLRTMDASSYTVPGTVTRIEAQAFANCSKLTSITLPAGVTSIGGSAFNTCTKLTSITLPDSVTSIGSFAFSNCSALTNITIPDKVTSIEPYTFEACTNLTGITLPASVTSIGGSAFSRCSALTTITYTGTTAQWTALMAASADINIRDGVTVVCTDGAFPIH